MKNNLEKGVKSFFDRPEGKVGKVAIVLMCNEFKTRESN
jgi:hypothetical protein